MASHSGGDVLHDIIYPLFHKDFPCVFLDWMISEARASHGQLGEPMDVGNELHGTVQGYRLNQSWKYGKWLGGVNL